MMSIDLFTLSWFVIFVVVILIAFLANVIIILAILRDKSMHTSTYYYIINVNIADIILVLSCLPERITEVFGSTYGFHLGMITCKYRRRDIDRTSNSMRIYDRFEVNEFSPVDSFSFHLSAMKNDC